MLLRLEKTFATRLDEEALSNADTVQDLVAALSAANRASGAPAAAQMKTETAARPSNIAFPGQAEEFPARRHSRKCCAIAGAQMLLGRT